MKSSINVFSIICGLFIYCLTVIPGYCAPVNKLPQPLPDSVKAYKYIRLYGNRPGMKNTKIFLNTGDIYSILATGSIDLWPGGPKYRDVRPENGWPFMMRIGKTPYKTPLQGKNAATLSADSSENLFLGVRDGKVDPYGSPLQPRYYDGNYGHFEVHVLVWATNDYSEIADFFKKLKESDPQNKSFSDAHDDAVQKKERFLYASKPILTIETGGHQSYMKDLIFTRDAKYLLSASNDKTIRVWDASTGELVRVIRGQIGEGYDGMIFSMALSPDNRFLAVGASTPGVIRVINFQTGQVEKLMKGHASAIVDLAFSPDGQRLISGSTDKRARIWEMHTGKTLHILTGHSERVHSVAFSHDGKRVATAGWDKTIRLWDSKNGRLIKSLEGHDKPVFSVAFTPDGKHLISGSADSTIRLWNANTGAFIKNFAWYPGPIKDLKIFAPGDRLIVTGGGKLRKTHSIVYSIPSGAVISTVDKTGAFIAAAITSDGNTAAIGSQDDPIVYLWDVSSGQKKQELKGKGEGVWSVGFSKDGRSIAWGKERQEENVFSYGPLQQAFQIKGKKDNFALGLGPELNSDNGYHRAIASVGPWSVGTKTGKASKTLQILENNTVVHSISRKQGAFYHGSLTMTPDGKTVISGGFNGHITSYDIKNGGKIKNFWGHVHHVNSLAVSPDGRLLVSGSSDQTVKLWDVETGRLLLSIFYSSDNEWIAWTPDGYYTASPGGDNYIGWHLNNGEGKSADYYSAVQFERILYRPDYVHAYLAHNGDRKNVEDALGYQFFDINNLISIAPPEITIISPSYRQKLSDDPQTVLKFSVDRNSIDMLDCSIFLNNIPVIPYSERMLEGEEKKHFTRELQIPLWDQKNKIRIEVFNGKSMGVAETVLYKDVLKIAKSPGDLYLLAVGINRFKNMPGNNLEYAASDAINLAKFFNKQKGHFNRIFTQVISDYSETKPSRADILNSLDFIKRSRGEDTVIVFLASHGLSDPAGNYYFVPGDAKTEDVKMLSEISSRGSTGSVADLHSLIGWKAFFDVLRAVPGKRLLVVDTCQAKNISGTFDIHSLAKRSATSSFALFAASKGNEESQEYPRGEQGLFTYALLKGLSGKGDRNKDGLVVLSELYDFVKNFVKENRSRELGSQTPQLSTPKELEGMVLGFH